MDASLSAEEVYSVLVIGGGAAGFFTAIATAEARPGTRIAILEATARVLSKVKVSGGGRCNVTHHLFEPKELIKRYPRGEKELLGPFHHFGPKETIEWFARHGVELKVEADGRMFPISNDSQTVVDALLGAQKKAGVSLQTRAWVQEVTRDEQGFRLRLKDGRVLRCTYLVLATGSVPAGYEILEQLGHKLVAPVPSLFTFEISDPLLEGLSGQSFPMVQAKLEIEGVKKHWLQSGPALITHWGLSGPAILKLSAFAARELAESHYHGTLTINWCGLQGEQEVLDQLEACRQQHGKRQLTNEHPFSFARRFWESLLQKLGIPQDKIWAQLSRREIQEIGRELTQGKFTIKGKGAFKEEFVTAGGVSRRDLDFRTMESRLSSGLYCVGELVDVDGITGGFNFQNAWTGGWLCAQHLASRLES